MITLNNRDLSKLARIKSGRPEGDIKHTEMLGEFARALGYSNAPTMMAMAKAKDVETAAPAPQAPEQWPGPVVMGEWMAERAREQPSGPVVLGKFRSDDKAVKLSIDVRPWLATLSADDFRRLVSDEFEDLGNSAFHHLRDQSEELRALEDYIGPNPVARTAAGDPIGFTTNINRLTSVEWMVRNRPDLKETILDLHDEFGIDWSPDAVPESWDIPLPQDGIEP